MAAHDRPSIYIKPENCPSKTHTYHPNPQTQSATQLTPISEHPAKYATVWPKCDDSYHNLRDSIVEISRKTWNWVVLFVFRVKNCTRKLEWSQSRLDAVREPIDCALVITAITIRVVSIWSSLWYTHGLFALTRSGFCTLRIVKSIIFSWLDLWCEGRSCEIR